jgi:MoaE-MoaD fusion protein
MRVRVLFFAALRERLQRTEASLDLNEGATVADLWAALCDQHQLLQESERAVSFAVNREYVRRDHRLSAGDEIALIPPVSGG